MLFFLLLIAIWFENASGRNSKSLLWELDPAESQLDERSTKNLLFLRAVMKFPVQFKGYSHWWGNPMQRITALFLERLHCKKPMRSSAGRNHLPKTQKEHWFTPAEARGWAKVGAEQQKVQMSSWKTNLFFHWSRTTFNLPAWIESSYQVYL